VCKSAASLVRKPEVRKSHIRFDERDLETDDMVRYSDTDTPKGSETVTAEPTSTAPDLDSTKPRNLFFSVFNTFLNSFSYDIARDVVSAYSSDWLR
jgi:hypothetical protein